jgi:pyruvate kinase
MVRIIHAVEEKMDIFNKEWPIEPNSSNFLRESLLYSACKLAKDTKAKAIVGFSRTGFTATKISSCRPQAYIYIFTDNKVILNQLNLVWGVRAFYMEPKSTTDETIDAMTEVLLKKDLVKKGDVIINTSTMPMESNFRTNMVKLTVV